MIQVIALIYAVWVLGWIVLQISGQSPTPTVSPTLTPITSTNPTIIPSRFPSIRPSSRTPTTSTPTFVYNWYLTGAPLEAWYGLASSASGQNITGCVQGGLIYQSNNEGASWKILNPQSLNNGTLNRWTDISVSANGLVILAVAAGIPSTTLNSSEVGGTFLSLNGGKTWNNTILYYDKSLIKVLWISASVSTDGSHAAAVVNNGGVYLSSNSGKAWSLLNGISTSALWTHVSLSSNGSFIGVVGTNQQVYISNNYGVNFFIPGNSILSTWTSIAISASGQYIVASVYLGNIYISTNGGVTITAAGSSLVYPWIQIRADATGRYVVATTNGNGIFTSTNFGATFIQSNTNKNVYWKSLAISQSGGRIFAGISIGPIYTTYPYLPTATPTKIPSPVPSVSYTPTNRPTTATPTLSILPTRNPTAYPVQPITSAVPTTSDYNRWARETSAPSGLAWYAVASDPTGQYLLACVQGGFLWYSGNDGLTWTKNTFTTAINVPLNWYSVAVSGIKSGQQQYPAILVAVAEVTGVFISNEGISTGAFNRSIVSVNSVDYSSSYWIAVACSSNANAAAIVIVIASVVPSNLFVSSNQGDSWSIVTGLSSNILWESITLDSTGNNIAAASAVSSVSGQSGIYLSFNVGVTFQLASAPTNLNWYSVAQSNAGNSRYIYAAAYQSGIYYSGNKGTSFQPSSISGSTNAWFAVVCSSNGEYVVAASALDGIYRSSNYGVSFVISFKSDFNWYGLASDKTTLTNVVAVANPGGIYGTYSGLPTYSPTAIPTRPTSLPTSIPSNPTFQPTTAAPISTVQPTLDPTAVPLPDPSSVPIAYPSYTPTTRYPSVSAAPVVIENQSTTTNKLSAGTSAGIAIAIIIIITAASGVSYYFFNKAKKLELEYGVRKTEVDSTDYNVYRKNPLSKATELTEKKGKDSDDIVL